MIPALLASAKLIKTERPKFPEQDRFVYDKSQFITACCTRRAGKSTGLGRRFFRTMMQYPGSLNRYIALTRDSAKDIMWGALQELNEAEGWDCDFVESTLTMVAPNKSRLRLYGADMKNFIRRLRGAKTASNAIDEAQEFNDETIVDLVDNILTPTMADYQDSWLAITGTPGPTPRGLFYDISHEGKFGYSIHKWSLLNNPYMPDPHGFVAKEKARKGWNDRTPAYMREYLGQWVLDLESLLIRYDSDKAGYSALPRENFRYIMGIDLGFNDADALAVLGWSDQSPTTYLVEEVVTRGQGLTELVEQIQSLRSKYDIAKLVIDEGGLGKKLAEELRRRHHIPVQPADKMRKFENVAFLNDALKNGKFKAKQESRFVQDSYGVQIDHERTTPDRMVVKKGFHSDIIDAVLYAFKESPAFTYQKPILPPKPKTDEWFKQEVEKMEKAAEDHFQKINQSEEGFGV